MLLEILDRRLLLSAGDLDPAFGGVETNFPELSQETARRAARQSDGRLVVLDEGRGIRPGEEDELFKRFHRGRSDRPGTGLGLAIVKLLAERWGGSASIGNREGGGARVEVALPVEQRTRVPA